MTTPIRWRCGGGALALLISRCWSLTCQAQAVVLESATLGATGQFGGASVTVAQFVGWRFQLDAPLVIDRIGAHMLNNDLPGGVFAALVALPSLEAFPQGDPFTAEETIAHTVFDPPFPSNEFRTPLHAVINPGAYALVFGTGLYGATGEGALPNTFDQNDIPPTNISSFIFYGLTSPGSPKVWRTNLASHMRIVIEGHVPIAADFDDDGEVDAQDLALWQAGFGTATAATHLQGDANADGAVDGADFLVWQQELGTTIASATPSTVPEPAALAAALIACLAAPNARSRAGDESRAAAAASVPTDQRAT